jgi:nicotinamidase/pyrazinamidase
MKKQKLSLPARISANPAVSNPHRRTIELMSAEVHTLPPVTLTDHDALLVIDMQDDFVSPTGSLSVPGGEGIVPGINALAAHFTHVILTQDWHPAGHISLASTHGLKPFTDTVQAPYGIQHLWPDHCLQGSPGAELYSALCIPHAELILRKGFRRDIDSYSAFTENDRTTTTGLAAYLQARGLHRLFFCGLAYDYCVGFSAIAAAQLGFDTWVIEDLCRGIATASIEATNKTFADLNVRRISSEEVLALEPYAR